MNTIYKTAVSTDNIVCLTVSLSHLLLNYHSFNTLIPTIPPHRFSVSKVFFQTLAKKSIEPEVSYVLSTTNHKPKSGLPLHSISMVGTTHACLDKRQVPKIHRIILGGPFHMSSFALPYGADKVFVSQFSAVSVNGFLPIRGKRTIVLGSHVGDILHT